MCSQVDVEYVMLYNLIGQIKYYCFLFLFLKLVYMFIDFSVLGVIPAHFNKISVRALEGHVGSRIM